MNEEFEFESTVYAGVLMDQRLSKKAAQLEGDPKFKKMVRWQFRKYFKTKRLGSGDDKYPRTKATVDFTGFMTESLENLWDLEREKEIVCRVNKALESIARNDRQVVAHPKYGVFAGCSPVPPPPYPAQWRISRTYELQVAKIKPKSRKLKSPPEFQTLAAATKKYMKDYKPKGKDLEACYEIGRLKVVAIVDTFMVTKKKG